MATRGISLTVCYLAWDTAANAGKTGDVANHTLRLVKDGTSAAPTNSPSEVDATNAPGAYKLVLTAAETDFNVVWLFGKSSTADVVIVPQKIELERLPDADPDAAGGLPVSDAGGLDLDTLLGRLDAAVSTRSSHAASAVWAVVLENSKTAAQITRGIWSILRGKTSGLTAGVGTAVFRDDADAKDRLSGVVDANGNRTTVTILDLD